MRSVRSVRCVRAVVWDAAKGLSKMKTLKRLRAQGAVEAREVPTHNRGGRKILFRIAEESAAKPALPAG